MLGWLSAGFGERSGVGLALGESQRPLAGAEVLSMLWKGGEQRGVGTRGVMCQAHLKAHLTPRGRQGFTARPQSRGCFGTTRPGHEPS